MRKLLLIVLVFLCGAFMNAQEIIRPVASAYTIGIGSYSTSDTYLTPLRYSGWSADFSYSRFQAMKFSPEKWVHNLGISAGFGSTMNPARNATMLTTGLSARWAMMRYTVLPCFPSVRIYGGGEAEANIGALYLSRNGNNPVAAKASVTAGITGMACWNFSFKGLPMMLRWQTSLPIFGCFFSQQYGQLYYEIYLGDTSGLSHFAHPGNYFRFCNEVSIDLRFGSTWVRTGYRNNLVSTRVNHLSTHLSANSFIFGLSGEWLSLNSRKKLSADAKIISAIY